MREMRLAKQREKGEIPDEPPEQVPSLFPDLFWIWSTFCFLSERRNVGANGPLPITVEAMNAYAQMSNRYIQPYLSQILLFIPILDRTYLHDFYEKQRVELEQQRKKSEQSGRKPARSRSLG